MKYSALLRGINVGGNRKVEMSKLKVCFEALGFANVVTYINSGNVVFSSDKPQAEVGGLIENEIERKFGFFVPTIVRSYKQIEQVVKQVPIEWTNDAQQKTDVLFLWPEIDQPSIVEMIGFKSEIERVVYIPGAMVWNIERKFVTKSNMLKLVGTNTYKQMTIRNINTVRKLYILMSLE